MGRTYSIHMGHIKGMGHLRAGAKNTFVCRDTILNAKNVQKETGGGLGGRDMRTVGLVDEGLVRERAEVCGKVAEVSGAARIVIGWRPSVEEYSWWCRACKHVK